MTTENKITAAYIVEQSKILSDEELIELIKAFGEQGYSLGADIASRY